MSHWSTDDTSSFRQTLSQNTFNIDIAVNYVMRKVTDALYTEIADLQALYF